MIKTGGFSRQLFCILPQDCQAIFYKLPLHSLPIFIHLCHFSYMSSSLYLAGITFRKTPVRCNGLTINDKNGHFIGVDHATPLQGRRPQIIHLHFFQQQAIPPALFRLQWYSALIPANWPKFTHWRAFPHDLSMKKLGFQHFCLKAMPRNEIWIPDVRTC